MLAQLTESLVPGPLLPTLLAAQALTAAGGRDGGAAAGEALGAIAAGAVSVAVALDPSEVTATAQPDGSLELAGRGPVSAAAVESAAPARRNRHLGSHNSAPRSAPTASGFCCRLTTPASC